MPERRCTGARERLAVAAAAARDHVAAVGEERAVTREHDAEVGGAEALEQALRIRDHGVRDARQVVARDRRVPLRQHRPQAGFGVAPVVLHVDDEERGALPVDLELGPGHVPAGEGLRRVDGRKLAHLVASTI
jgi:hypothetical protein